MKIKHSVAKVNLFDLHSAPHFLKKKPKNQPQSKNVTKDYGKHRQNSVKEVITWFYIIYRT
jgi:hypothetical protein